MIGRLRFTAPALVLTMLFVVLLLAVKSVTVQHQQRVLFAELSRQEHRRDQLLDEWSRLQLELSTLGARDRIRSTAIQRLDMHTPAARDFILIEP